MPDQEEHSAETETGERVEVIKGRTELDREMGRVQNTSRGWGGSKRKGQQVKKQGKR